MWYGLFLQTDQVFGNTVRGKVISVLTSFVYAIYHFASINEIHSFAAMTEEIFITFGISVSLAAMCCSVKASDGCCQLALNYHFLACRYLPHILQLVYSYMIVILLLVIYHILEKAESADR